MNSDIRRDLDDLPGLPPKRAFWEALATVGIPSLLISSVVLYWVGFRADEWLIYAVVFFVPVVLLLPVVFIRYLNGVKPRKLTQRQHIIRTIVCGSMAACFAGISFWEWHDGMRMRPTWPIMALAWLVIAADHLRNARKAEDAVSAPQ